MTECSFGFSGVIKFTCNNLQGIQGLLDASKYEKLFSSLMSKGLHPLLIQVLVNVYMCTDPIVRVKWNLHTTNIFKILNGMKKGGVLFLLCIWMGLHKTKEIWYGYYVVYRSYARAFGYGNDVTLLAATRYQVQSLATWDPVLADKGS